MPLLLHSRRAASQAMTGGMEGLCCFAPYPEAAFQNLMPASHTEGHAPCTPPGNATPLANAHITLAYCDTSLSPVTLATAAHCWQASVHSHAERGTFWQAVT